MSYLIVVLLIGLLIFVHELGHFLAARAVGIPIATFSIGFGPALLSRKWRGTRYVLAWIPLGGYVMPAVKDEHEMYSFALWRRLVFLAGGPLANVLLAVPAFALSNTLADGPTWSGILLEPWLQTALFCGMFVVAIPMLFTRPDQLSGVVGIVANGEQFVGGGVAQTVSFAILLTLNLAIFNLLPIPVLDGGKMLMAVLDRIHPRFRALQLPLTLAGLVLLIALMLFATVMDISKLV